MYKKIDKLGKTYTIAGLSCLNSSPTNMHQTEIRNDIVIDLRKGLETWHMLQSDNYIFIILQSEVLPTAE